MTNAASTIAATTAARDPLARRDPLSSACALDMWPSKIVVFHREPIERDACLINVIGITAVGQPLSPCDRGAGRQTPLSPLDLKIIVITMAFPIDVAVGYAGVYGLR